MDRLHAFLGSEARAKLLAHFVVHPDWTLHIRALERHTGIGKRSLQTELERLEEMGLLRREHQDRRVVYARSKDARAWQPIQALVCRYGPTLVLQHALMDIPGLAAAFVFGSVARGDAREDSDIDVLLYGDSIGEKELGAALHNVVLALDKKLDVKRYDRKRFRNEARNGSGFLVSALRGPKIWLTGSPSDLPVRIHDAA